MELWEGALLIVGGVWLVGKVSRNSPNHPVNATQVALSPNQPAGNTIGTQTDGSNNLVWGEPLAPPTPPLPTNFGIRTIAPVSDHIASHPTITTVQMNPIPARFTPIPSIPAKSPTQTPRPSPYANNVLARTRFLDL